MDVAVGKRWEPLLDELVGDGTYTSAEDVVAEGLNLVAARKRKTDDLKATIEAAIARGGRNNNEDLTRRLAAVFGRLGTRS